MKLFFVFNGFINFKWPIEFEVKFWWTNLTFVSLCVAVTNLIPPVVWGWKRFQINYDVARHGEEGLLSPLANLVWFEPVNLVKRTWVDAKFVIQLQKSVSIGKYIYHKKTRQLKNQTTGALRWSSIRYGLKPPFFIWLSHHEQSNFTATKFRWNHFWRFLC